MRHADSAAPRSTSPMPPPWRACSRRSAPSRCWRSTPSPTASTSTGSGSACCSSPPASGDFIVDPLAVDVRPLGEILCDGRETVLHGADYDVRCLRREYGWRLPRLFDTMVAARRLGRPGLGLSALVEARFGVRHVEGPPALRLGAAAALAGSSWPTPRSTPSSSSPSPTSSRPSWRSGGLADQAEQEFQRIAAVVPKERVFDPEGWRRLKGAARARPGRQGGAAGALARPRGARRARTTGRPSRCWASRPWWRSPGSAPPRREALARIPGVSPQVLRRLGDAIDAALREPGQGPGAWTPGRRLEGDAVAPGPGPARPGRARAAGRPAAGRPPAPPGPPSGRRASPCRGRPPPTRRAAGRRPGAARRPAATGRRCRRPPRRPRSRSGPEQAEVERRQRRRWWTGRRAGRPGSTAGPARRPSRSAVRGRSWPSPMAPAALRASGRKADSRRITARSSASSTPAARAASATTRLRRPSGRASARSGAGLAEQVARDAEGEGRLAGEGGEAAGLHGGWPGARRGGPAISSACDAPRPAGPGRRAGRGAQPRERWRLRPGGPAPSPADGRRGGGVAPSRSSRRRASQPYQPSPPARAARRSRSRRAPSAPPSRPLPVERGVGQRAGLQPGQAGLRAARGRRTRMLDQAANQRASSARGEAGWARAKASRRATARLEVAGVVPEPGGQVGRLVAELEAAPLAERDDEGLPRGHRGVAPGRLLGQPGAGRGAPQHPLPAAPEAGIRSSAPAAAPAPPPRRGGPARPAPAPGAAPPGRRARGEGTPRPARPRRGPRRGGRAGAAARRSGAGRRRRARRRPRPRRDQPWSAATASVPSGRSGSSSARAR